MAGRFEPFLINPPRKLKRRARRFKLNDWQPGMEMADPSEMGIGIKPGHTGMKKRGRKRGGKKKSAAAKKAWKTRRLKSKEKVMAKARKRRKTRVSGRKRRATPAQLRALRKARAARKRKLSATKAPTRRRRRTRKTARRRRTWTATGYKYPRIRKRVKSRRRRRTSLGKRRLLAVYGRREGKKLVFRTGPRKHKYGIKRNFRVNPFGEEAMIIGSNPMRRRRRRRKSYKTNPKRRRAMARGRRKYSMNPLKSIKSLMPMIAAGTVGALATKALPRVIGVTNVWAVYGTQAVAVFGGGWVADKMMGRSISDGWIVGGASVILSNLLSGMLGGVFAGLGLEYDAFPMGAFPDEQPMGMLGEMNGIGGLGMAEEFEPTMVY